MQVAKGVIFDDDFNDCIKYIQSYDNIFIYRKINNYVQNNKIDKTYVTSGGHCRIFYFNIYGIFHNTIKLIFVNITIY